MSTVNLNNLALAFRSFAGSVAVSGGKTAIGKESHSETAKSPVRLIRDQFTLSKQGQLAYENFVANKSGVNKWDKTNQNQTTTQATDQVAESSRIFSTAPGSVDSLARLLGLDTINGNDTTLAGALNLSIEVELQEFSDRMVALLQEVGLMVPDEAADLSFSVALDIEGNAVIAADNFGDDEKREQLTTLINSDSALVGQLKNLWAKMQMAHTLETENELDVSSDELAWAREHLMESFLQREGGLSLDDVAIKTDTGVKSLFQQDSEGNEVEGSRLQSLLAQMPELESELLRYLESPPMLSGKPFGGISVSISIRDGVANWEIQGSKENNEAARSSEPVENETTAQQDVSEPAEYIPTLTLNDDGMPILTHADGSTSMVGQVMTEKWVFTPGENDILALDTSPWGEVVGAYLDFRSQAMREVAAIPQLAGIMSDPFDRGIFLSQIFSQVPDVHNSNMQEFEAYSARITQGIQDLRDVLDLRQKLGLGNDFFGEMHASVMASIVNGNPTSILATVIDGEKVSLGTEYINASWLRALDKVASAEGLAAARSREDAGLGLSYYDVNRGMQVMLQVAHTGGTGFTFRVMEYSLKDPADKGTVIAQHSGNNFSEWLNSSSNFLSKLYDNDFQDWLGMMKKRVVGWW